MSAISGKAYITGKAQCLTENAGHATIPNSATEEVPRAFPLLSIERQHTKTAGLVH